VTISSGLEYLTKMPFAWGTLFAAGGVVEHMTDTWFVTAEWRVVNFKCGMTLWFAMTPMKVVLQTDRYIVGQIEFTLGGLEEAINMTMNILLFLLLVCLHCFLFGVFFVRRRRDMDVTQVAMWVERVSWLNVSGDENIRSLL
jgi:hypothetical protein